MSSDRDGILPVLYDIAVTIGGETSLRPLLTRTLQRLLYYTSYPVGFICLDLPAGAAGEDGCIQTRVHAAVGDLDLIDHIGQDIRLPRALIDSQDLPPERQAATLQQLHPVAGSYRSFRCLRIEPDGVLVLLAPLAPETRLPLQQMFKPVLAHLSRAILLCRRNDAYMASLQAERQLYAEVFESSASAVMITDREGQILAVNPAFSRITGYRADEVKGRTSKLRTSAAAQDASIQEIWHTVERQGHWQGELWNQRKNGERYPQWLNLSRVLDQQGQTSHYVGIFSDISDEKKTAELLHQMAFFDALTELPNRRLLMDRLHQACTVSARSGQHGALLFIDLDNFKDINDAKGHDTGDQLLKEVARRLLHRVREGDTVARLGGDEFVIILSDLGMHSIEAAARAEVVAETLLNQLSQPYTLSAYTVYTTPSIGIVMFQGHCDNADTLLKYADISMYRAKTDGGNGIRFFDPRMQQEINVRTSLVDALHQALQSDQLSLQMQFQVDHLEQITGAEMLMRWQHPQRGAIAPTQFIPLAEDSGLIVPIGLWCLRMACQQLVEWSASPRTRELSLSINVSARQFRQSDFVAQVRHVLATTGANPRRLNLELTEGAMLENPDDTARKMRELRQLGLSFALDDFGTGYSSLQHLRLLPINQIKIDQSFIRNITNDANDATIVKTIIAMADALGIQVIAEGVETQAQRDYLERNGCLRYQGYLFSTPVPVDKMNRIVRQSRFVGDALYIHPAQALT